MDDNVKQITELLRHPHKAVLTLHTHPDADSMASNLAMAKILRDLGSTVDVFAEDPVPTTYSFVPGFDTISQKKVAEIAWDKFDTYWALDMSDTTRPGKGLSLPKDLRVVMIDHHITNKGWGTVNWVDPGAASTASLLLKLCIDAGIPIGESLANILLFGILGDTSIFTNTNTTPKVFADASLLMQKGANYQYLVYQMLRQTRYEDLQFVSKALARARINIQKRALLVPIPYEVWNQVGTSLNKEELLEKYTKQVKGTDFGALLIETEPNLIRISLRSRKPEYDVAAIAQKLGGGGHTVAAGAKLVDITLDKAMEKVLELA